MVPTCARLREDLSSFEVDGEHITVPVGFHSIGFGARRAGSELLK